MMTSSGQIQSVERDTGLWTAVSLLALAVFFVGCACFTMADIFLGSNNAASAVFAVVGVPLFIVGGITLLIRSRIGEPAGPPRSRR